MKILAEKKSALIPLLEAMQLACPNLKTLLPKKILDIIDLCLQIFPSNRPSASTLLNFLTNITENLATVQINTELNETLNDING